MSAEAWAAWAQALLTVATFAAALLFQEKQRRRDARDRMLERTRLERERFIQRLYEARAVACTLLPDLIPVRSRAAAYKDFDWDLVSESVLETLQFSDLLSRHAALSSSLLTATPHVQRATSLLVSLRGFVSTLSAKDGITPKHREVLRKGLQDLEESTRSAIDATNALFKHQ